MRISDWSSDVCSSDLAGVRQADDLAQILVHVLSRFHLLPVARGNEQVSVRRKCDASGIMAVAGHFRFLPPDHLKIFERRFRQRRACERGAARAAFAGRSEEHTSELQSLMRISYAVFCLTK